MKTGVEMFRWKLKMGYADGCVSLDEVRRDRVKRDAVDALARRQAIPPKLALETFYFFPTNTPTSTHPPQQHDLQWSKERARMHS